jgi:hypothetical protein
MVPQIGVSYLQVNALIQNMDMQWPQVLVKFWRYASQVISPMDSLISLDCSLPPSSVPKPIARTLIKISPPGAMQG